MLQKIKPPRDWKSYQSIDCVVLNILAQRVCIQLLIHTTLYTVATGLLQNLLCVRFFVFFVTREAVESFSTNVAGVVELDMRFRHVVTQFVLTDEFFIADLAREIGRAALVLGHVLVVIGSLIEAFLAVFAEERELPRVDLHVPAEAGRARVRSAAAWPRTRIPLFVLRSGVLLDNRFASMGDPWCRLPINKPRALTSH